MKTSNKILVLLGIGLFVFTIVMIVIFFIKDSIPDTLVTCVFAACTGEFSVLGWIKTSKEKYRGIEDSPCDESVDESEG